MADLGRLQEALERAQAALDRARADEARTWIARLLDAHPTVECVTWDDEGVDIVARALDEHGRPVDVDLDGDFASWGPTHGTYVLRLGSLTCIGPAAA